MRMQLKNPFPEPMGRFTGHLSILIIYLSYTYHILIIYVSYTYHIRIIYVSYTYHILIIYLSHTYHYPHLINLKNHGFWPIHRRCFASNRPAGLVVHPPSLHRPLGAQWSGAAVQDLSASDSGGPCRRLPWMAHGHVSTICLAVFWGDSPWNLGLN